MDDGSGPDSKYLFRPALITLDEDFRVTRKLEADAFSSQPATSINTEKLRLGAVTGRLGFNEENRHDRYVIVLTEPAVLNETTTIVVHSPYPFTVRKFRHAPTGNIRIELTTTQDLFGEAKQRLARNYESAKPGQRYEASLVRCIAA